MAKVVVPAHVLPETLFVQVGTGGVGKSSGGGTAGSGVRAYVSLQASGFDATNLLCRSSTTAPTGGGTGTVAVQGTGGNGGTIPTIAGQPLAGLGTFAFIAGQAGTAGGVVANGAGSDQTIPTTSVLCMGGTGGGGVTTVGQNGGTITAIAGSFLSEQAPAQCLASGVSGSTFQLWKPFFSFSGMGGSSADAAVGGAGGYGSYGAGGGGGGGGTTGGRGGDGGGGIVIMTAW